MDNQFGHPLISLRVQNLSIKARNLSISLYHLSYEERLAHVNLPTLKFERDFIDMVQVYSIENKAEGKTKSTA